MRPPRPLTSTEPRVCVACGHLKPIRMFAPGAYRLSDGAAYPKRTCRTCEAKRRGRTPARTWPPKRNAAGQYHCRSCNRYLAVTSFRKARGAIYCYCRECEGEMRRIAYRAKVATPGVREALSAHHADLKKRERRRMRDERIKFMRDAIRLLLRRGLTKADIRHLSGTSRCALWRWERGEAWVKQSSVNRIMLLLRATTHLPATEVPAHRRNLPREQYAVIEAELRLLRGDVANV